MFHFNNLSTVITTTTVTAWSTSSALPTLSSSHNGALYASASGSGAKNKTSSLAHSRNTHIGNISVDPTYRNVSYNLMPKNDTNFVSLLTSPKLFRHNSNGKSPSSSPMHKTDSIESGSPSHLYTQQDSCLESLSPNHKCNSILRSLSPSPQHKLESSLSPNPLNKFESSLSLSPQHKFESSLSPSPKRKVEFTFSNLSPVPRSECDESNGRISPNPSLKLSISPSSPSTNEKNDSNNNKDKSDSIGEASDISLKPPSSLHNCSPYDFQLLKKLLPRHITTEHVIFSHKTKVAGRSLYFFSPAFRGSPTKPVFTTREKVITLLDSYVPNGDDPTNEGSPTYTTERSSSNSPSRKKKEETIITGVCTLKRVHLFDPACDMGVSVWRGRGPRKGLKGPQKPPSGIGPALLVEARDPRNGDGMAVAAGFHDEVMYLVPDTLAGKPEMESRTTEIIVEESMLISIAESVAWYLVKNYSQRRLNVSMRPPHSPRLNIGKLKKSS